MQILDPTKVNNILYHYNHIAHAKDGAFYEDLRGMPASKFKTLLKTLKLEETESQDKTIMACIEQVKKIAEEMRMSHKKKQEKKEIAPAVVEAQPEANVEPQAPAKPPIDITPVELKVNPKYKAMIPRPSKEQLQMIEESLKKDGLQEKIKVLPDMTIWDGHTRHDLIKKLELPLTADMIEVVDISEADIPYHIFMLNVARRHLSDVQKISGIKKFLPQIKEEIKKEKEKVKKEKVSNKKERKEGGVKPAIAPKKDRAVTRAKVAEKAGVSTSDVKLHDWLEKRCPRLLKEGEEKGVKIGTIYAQGQKWYKLVKEHDPEALKKVEEGKLDLEDAYNAIVDKVPVPEPESGPLEKNTAAIKDIYWNKILKKKYGENITPDEFEVDFVNKLDAMISRYSETEKK